MHHQGLLGVVLDGVLGTSARSAPHLAVSLSLSSSGSNVRVVSRWRAFEGHSITKELLRGTEEKSVCLPMSGQNLSSRQIKDFLPFAGRP